MNTDELTYIVVAAPKGTDPLTDEILVGLREELLPFGLRVEESPDDKYRVVRAHVDPRHSVTDHHSGSKLTGLGLSSMAMEFIGRKIYAGRDPFGEHPPQ